MQPAWLITSSGGLSSGASALMVHSAGLGRLSTCIGLALEGEDERGGLIADVPMGLALQAGKEQRRSLEQHTAIWLKHSIPSKVRQYNLGSVQVELGHTSWRHLKGMQKHGYLSVEAIPAGTFMLYLGTICCPRIGQGPHLLEDGVLGRHPEGTSEEVGYLRI